MSKFLLDSKLEWKKKWYTESVGTLTLLTASQAYVLPEIRKREIEEPVYVLVPEKQIKTYCWSQNEKKN